MGPGFVLAIVLYILGFAFFSYVCFVADPEKSPVAFFVTERLPKYVGSRLQKIFGTKSLRFFNILVDHILVVFYLVLVLGSWSIMFTYGYTWITESTHVSSFHKYSGYFVFVLCVSSWRYASNVNPGIITERTMAKFDHYPYDDLLFVPNRICPTVGIRKLARSKYDRFSEQHVARFDHFCGWLNQPVGEENYRFFLWFLLVHTLMCAYGTYVTAQLFWGEVLEKALLSATFFDTSTGKEVDSNWSIVTNYLFRRHLEMASVLLLMGTMSVVLGAFLGFHAWITSRGMTTNETAKWKQVRKWHKQETKRYRQAVKAGTLQAESMSKETGNVINLKHQCDGNVTTKGQDASDSVQYPLMDPGPMPENVYDNGFVENWREVIFPRSLRPDAVERWRRSFQRSENSEIPGKSKAY